jgi:hypothetical protein
MRDESAIAEIAAVQHGLVTRAQLAAAGFDKSAISRAVGAGRLHRVHRGVYAVGHRRTDNLHRWMAGVLACGTSALLSHASAAAHWGLRPATLGPVHVTVPTGNGRRKRKGVVIHRALEPEGDEHHGIPVTSPRQTLEDIRRTLSSGAYRRAVEQAEILRLDTGPITTEGPPTRSELEDAFLSLAESLNLPKPITNRRTANTEVDFRWPAHNLIVEVDGWETHGTRTAFERDRRRDAVNAAEGLTTLRFTWRQVMRRAPELQAALYRSMSSIR